jgi:hypothetical protein
LPKGWAWKEEKWREEEWVYCDNKWENPSRKPGAGKYTRRRKLVRNAELMEREMGDTGTRSGGEQLSADQGDDGLSGNGMETAKHILGRFEASSIASLGNVTGGSKLKENTHALEQSKKRD